MADTKDTTTLQFAHHDELTLLTVPEVAAGLRCSKAHIHNLINGTVDGMEPLPAVWLGRRRLVRRASLDQWVIRCEHRQKLTPQDA